MDMLKIKNARRDLQELYWDIYLPNDFWKKLKNSKVKSEERFEKN